MARFIHRPRASWLAAGFLASAATSLVSVGSARAEDLGAIEKKLGAAEMQARDVITNLPAPEQASATTKTEAQPKRLVQAQLAFRAGSYSDAALVLFDIAAKGRSPEYDPALYYLGESLFQKGDKVAARAYFTQLVTDVGAASKYYKASLKRLVELAIELGGAEGIDQQVLALDNSAAGSYVRGKWQYAQGQHDDALRSFADVSKESSYGLQAQYFIGAVNVAKKDLAKASEAFLDAVNRKPKTNVDRRIIELSQLALGRVFYEREQPSKSVDWYLAIDRRSDLFSDALFEASWVYVKSKQFDKALSALELLSAQDPLAQKTPTVRILEGNLRVRKAQLLRQALITGLEANGDPADEYIKAEALFRDTKDQYAPAHAELRRVLDEKIDPALYLAQVTGRDSETFAVSAQMPEIAASWVRDEGSVGQLVTVEGDLGDIQANIAEGERTIARLEAMLAVPHGANAYPLLAERRARANELVEQVIQIRTTLADEQAKLVNASSETSAASSARMGLAAQLAGLPNAELAYRDRLAKAQSEFDALDETLIEVESAIGESEASTSALRTYGKQLKAAAVVAAPVDAVPAPVDAKPAPAGPAPTVPAPVVVDSTVLVVTAQAQIDVALSEMDPEVVAMKAELASVRSEMILGRDIAGTGDEFAVQAAALRKQMRAAQDVEHRALAAASSRDAGKSRKLSALSDQAARVASMLEESIIKIDATVDTALVGVRSQLVTEKQELAAERADFLEVEAESRAVGAMILATGFRNVKAKLYDVVIRADVGNVDVHWSQKEDIDQDVKRFQLERTREVKQIRDEFRDVLDKVAPPITNPTPAAPAAAPTTPAPTPAASTTPAPTPAGVNK